MTDCSWLSDRMPAVALGRAQWTPEEARHLTSCRSCQDEWELVRMTSQLGEGVDLGLDVASASRAVLHSLTRVREERLRRRARSFAGLAAAAIIAAIVWIDRPPARPPSAPAETVVATLQIPLPELDGLQPAELDSVLQVMDELMAGGSTPDGAGSPEVETEELEDVLNSWEG